MGTVLAIAIGALIAWLWIYVGRQMKREKDAKERQRRNLVVPEGPGVVELTRPLLISKYALNDRQWEKLLSDYVSAGWVITTHNPVWNSYTLVRTK